ncbi:MAG: HEAT repeat domain-containing protein [candidate division Zixibacteria bacterium]|nr:HEAT repeat domain-containing protein [candidate division Zixibacteria bacterium]
MTEEKATLEKPKIEELRFLFGLFSKTVKTVMLYPPDNPLPKEFKKNFSEKFCAFLTSGGSVTLAVKPGEFWCGEEKVFVESTREESIATRMHTDGIREVTFAAETTPEEILAFLETFREMAEAAEKAAAADNGGHTDDLVARLWEKDLRHIRFAVVEAPFMQTLDTAPFEIKKEDTGKIEYSEIALDEQGKGELSAEDKKDDRQSFQPQVRAIVESLGDPQNLEKEELEGILERLAKEAGFDSFEMELFILRETLFLENDRPAFDETVTLLEKLFEEQLKAGNFSACSRILTVASEVGYLIGEESPQRRERLKTLMVRAGDRARVALLVKAVNANPEASVADFKTYLSFMNRPAFANMVAMLGDLESFAFRRAVCEALETKGSEVLDIVGNAVFDKRWFVVRNVTAVLGKIGGERALDYLKKPLTHPDNRVKKEALSALARIGTPKAYLLLAEALKDGEEKIRIMALQLLARCNTKELLAPLAAGMEAKDFSKKSDEEKKAWFEAAAKVGQEEAVLPLVNKVKRFSLFGRRALHSEKLLAVEALGFCGNAAASFLANLAGSGNKEIAHRAQQALARCGYVARERER